MTSPLSQASDSLRLAPADPRAIVAVGDDVRFTVLTDRLIRMEHAPAGGFVDAATQLVVSRNFAEVPDFEVIRGEDRVDILTSHLHLAYQPSRGFSRSGLMVELRTAVLSEHGGTWHYGDVWNPDETYPTNFGGTCRTLDEADGRTTLNPGLLARNGCAVIDDSASLLMHEDEWVSPRPGTSPVDGSSEDEDLYFFGYGQDYHAALRDFFALTGPTPLIPRALLGNWWSRYHKYSESEYLELMDRFAAEKLPFSVAVIDMDWHWVDIDPAIGNGWTGYTWNTDLFPDPKRFLDELHRRGMQVTLNLHPAAGIRRHEAAYEPIARQLGLDPASGKEIPFNIADKAFTDAYLTHAHHTLEDEGVDFWWLDWQQGGVTDIPGLDPLWMLNHVHYLDSGRERTITQPDGSKVIERRRPITFSRFADASSHRTPIGFSGDTVTTWDSLRFQPEFTATAANIGYFWWSNDIGGHMFGVKDSQMMARWVQLGCFSPINRLHSTASVFNSKEPWRYAPSARETMNAYLRLRHRLVPYLYTWARHAHTDGVGVVRPVYHDFSTIPGAYSNRNEFLFGELLVMPMTSPVDRASGLACEHAWLAPGVWFDLVTGRRYTAAPEIGSMVALSRPLEQIPVLARAGSMVVLSEGIEEAAGDNPAQLGVIVVPGASGSFVLEEDDGSAQPDEKAVLRTRFEVSWDEEAGQAELRIQASGAVHVSPAQRTLTLHLLSAGVAAEARVVDDEGKVLRHLSVKPRVADGYTLGAGVDIELGDFDARELQAGVCVRLGGVSTCPPSLEDELFTIVERAEISYSVKDVAWLVVNSGLRGGALLSALRANNMPDALLAAIEEIA